MAEKREPPLWLDAVRKFERAIGDPIESVVTSEAYFDAVTRLKRAQAQVAGLVENVTDDVFRMLNIPAGSDIRSCESSSAGWSDASSRMSKELAKRDDAPPPDATKTPTEVTKPPPEVTKPPPKVTKAPPKVTKAPLDETKQPLDRARRTK